jgi:hypothetical protein
MCVWGRAWLKGSDQASDRPVSAGSTLTDVSSTKREGLKS